MTVSGGIEHMELDKGLDMVNKAGVGGKWISQKWLSTETNQQNYLIFHECCGWLVWGYLIFYEVVLRPESDVVRDICFNHVLILSHFSRGMDGRGEGSYVVVVSTYVHADRNGSIFQA